MTEHHYERDVTWRARYRSFFHAGRGVVILLATQWNARIHLLASIAVLILGLSLGLNTLEWCVILLAIALVWVAEALNTGLEFAVDLTSPQRHPLAGKAKDVAAGAVLIASLIAASIGALIFLPKIATWWGADLIL